MTNKQVEEGWQKLAGFLNEQIARLKSLMSKKETVMCDEIKPPIDKGTEVVCPECDCTAFRDSGHWGCLNPSCDWTTFQEPSSDK